MGRKFYQNSDTIPVIQYEESEPEGFTEVIDTDQLEELYYALKRNYSVEGHRCVDGLNAEWFKNVDYGTWTEAQYFTLLSYTKEVLMFTCMGMMDKGKSLNSALSVPSGVYTTDIQDEINEHLDDHILDSY